MIPERFNGDMDQKLKTLNESSSHCFTVQVAELSVYLFSNNLIPEDNRKRFVKWLTEETAADAVLKGIFNITSPTAQSFQELVFKTAAGLGHRNFKALVNTRACESCITGPVGQRCLYTATACKDIEVVRILLDMGVLPNIPPSTEFPESPLHNAAFELDCDMVELLLKAGADVSSLNNGNQSALCSAVIGIQEKLAAGEKFDYSCLQVLIKAGATFNGVEENLYYGTPAVDGLEIYRILSASCEDAKSKLPIGGILNAATGGLQALSQYLAKWETSFQIQREMLERSLWEAIPDYPGALVSLLEYGVDPNIHSLQIAITDKLQLPLIKAINENKIDQVSMLLGYGAEVNFPGVLAAASSHPWRFPILNFLINHGVDIHQFGASAIQAAFEFGNNLCAVKLLLASGIDINSSTPQGTVLAKAARSTDLKYVKYLVGQGAEVNPINHSYLCDTPLYAALSYGNWAAAKFLLECGADIKADSPKGTLLEVCSTVPTWKILDIGEKIEMFELLLSKGAKINGPSKRPLSPTWNSTLTQLVQYADRRVILLALEAGADVNQMGCGTGARTPIQAASEKGNLEIVQLLHSRGADINAPAGTEYGRTALQAACCLTPPNIELVEFLLVHGAEVNAPAGIQKGLTALQGAAIEGYIKVVIFLLDCGAEPNGDPALEDGRTALDGAAEHGRLDMVQFLLNVGAQSEIPGKTGYDKAIELANTGFHFAIADMLKSYSHTT